MSVSRGIQFYFLFYFILSYFVYFNFMLFYLIFAFIIPPKPRHTCHAQCSVQHWTT